jgi:hypothetical protein
MATKYEPLQVRLRQTPGSRIRFSFREIEAILGFALPRSARTHAPWWANVGGSHVQAEAWMGAGWRTCQVDVPGERVSFERTVGNRNAQHEAERPGVAEPGAALVPDDSIIVRQSDLRGGAMRLLEDYREGQGGSLADAVVGLLNAMALERRRQLLDRFPMRGPTSTIDSTDLIREDRDAR